MTVELTEPTRTIYHNNTVLSVLEDMGPLTRPEIVNITKIPRTTVFDALKRLELDERIRQYPVRSGERGRPRVLFEVRYQ